MIEGRVVVLGAGAWGTALAVTLANSGHPVTLCVRRPTQLEAIAASRRSVYLSGVELPRAVKVTDGWDAAVAGADIVIVAIPSQFVRASMVRVAPALSDRATLISGVKGIEQNSLKTMSQVLGELAPKGARLVALSGPGFAAEIAAGKPAALVAASQDDASARLTQRLVATRSLRVYRSADLMGVELGGAVKNVIAIAAGISDGLQLGMSARAALITRGLAEIIRLGTALGARIETLAGLSGLGDLVLTCSGELSRNRGFGLKLARGERTAGAQGPGLEAAPIAEGVANARAVKMLAERCAVEMPIVSAVYRCLYEGEAAKAMVEELLSRELKAEF